MRLLTQNVLNYPELLESSRRSKERLLLQSVKELAKRRVLWYNRGKGANM